jgi:hypothetical protein
MAESDIENLARIILGETSGLSGAGNDAAQSQERLWAVVAFIAQLARGNGLLQQMQRAGDMVPADEIGNYQTMKVIAEKIFQNHYDGPTPLPKQAVLWQLTRDGYPSFEVGKPPAWIFAAGATQGGQFKDNNGVLYRLYESGDAPPPGQTGFVSAYSSSGLAPPTWSVPERLRKTAWVVGFASALLFLLGGVSAIWSGQSDGLARIAINTTDTQYIVIDKLADNCIADQAQFPSWKRTICGFLPEENGKYVKPPLVSPAQTQPPAEPGAPVATAQAVTSTAPPLPPAKPIVSYGPKVGQALVTIRKCLGVGIAPEVDEAKPKAPAEADAAADEAQSCELVARSAAAAGIVSSTRPKSFADNLVRTILGLRAVPYTSSIIVQLIALTLGIAGLAIALGLGTKARIAGIWIDERNRVSLARAQVTLWTIVALGGFAAIALFNVGLGGPTAFPQIPASIAAALGIAFASPMISALILNTKDFGAAGSPSALLKRVGAGMPGSNDFSSRNVRVEASVTDPLETRDVPSSASLADVFVGEHVSDSDQVDISRLQNVALTVTLVLGYFAMLINQLQNIPAETLLSGVASLPDPGGAFTSVLLISHATYLGTKVYNASGANQDQ